MKFSIKNNIGLEIIGDILIPEQSRGLVFVEHGLGGFKDQKHIQLIANAFFEYGYTVVNFDATNSIGESGGRYEDATMRAHYDDLVCVIDWAKTQDWYTEPFIIAGHSLGGYAVARYAEEFPSKVKGVFPFALVVSGDLSLEAHVKFKNEEFTSWKETGWTHRTSNSKPGVSMKLPWSHMEERLNHDLRPNASKLTMPVLFVVGENDTSCPSDHEKILYDLIPGRKEFHFVSGAPHSFKTPEHLEELKMILSNWIDSLN